MPLQLPGNDQDRARIMKRVATELVHSYGMVVRKVNKTVGQAIAANMTANFAPRQGWDQYIADAQGAKMRARERARDAYQVYRRFWSNGTMCRNPPLDPRFVRLVMSGGLRNDQEVFLGMHTSLRNQVPVFRPAAVVAFGEADPVDNNVQAEDFENPEESFLHTPDGDYQFKFFKSDVFQEETQLNDNIENGRIMEVDLLCSSPNDSAQTSGVRGSGGALLLMAIMDVLARKRQGQFRYRGIITYAAGHQGVHPIEGTLLRLGFRSVEARVMNLSEPSNIREYRPLNRRYYVLDDVGGNRFQKLANSVPAGDEFSALCPTATGTGFTYCA